MTDAAPILDDRRGRVQMLLACFVEPTGGVDLSGVPGDPAAVAAAVNPDRLRIRVPTLDAGPHHGRAGVVSTTGIELKPEGCRCQGEDRPGRGRPRVLSVSRGRSARGSSVGRFALTASPLERPWRRRWIQGAAYPLAHRACPRTLSLLPSGALDD